MTKTINLRDLPDDLVRRAKACAALHGLTLKDFVIQAIERAVQEDIPAMPRSIAALGDMRLPKKRRSSTRSGRSR